MAPIPLLMLCASPWPAKEFALSELASIPPLKNILLKAKSYNFPVYQASTPTSCDNPNQSIIIAGYTKATVTQVKRRTFKLRQNAIHFLMEVQILIKTVVGVLDPFSRYQHIQD